ncbi:amino acid adenylation domain-containing protein [Actinoallomurus sp. NBC_01490]|uniref:non-ribosomal peptide synthetase n=1 Tax=Actinoallomurus sp. NBC_01490 TaxID=2903557 RepID=UPI002E2F0331|nr:amino acid adenylation domain-containing protein [Actinoallomurus sp. NBC_01490]
MTTTKPDVPSVAPPAGGAALPDRFPLTDLQSAYMVGRSRVFELGGRQNYYLESEIVGLDPGRAEDAVNKVVERHEQLRTVMSKDGYQRVMGVEETPRVRVPVIDLTDLDRDRQEESIRQIRERMCGAGLDPAGWPLFEVVVSRLRPHRVRVHLRMSLILLDGSSMRTVISDWLEYYKNPGIELPPVHETFRQWRLSRLAREDDEEFRRQLAYWEERLDTLPEAPRLPTARQAAGIDSVWFTGRTSRLTEQQWRRFCANFRKHRVLPSTALLHVFAEALGAWAETPHFCLNFVHQYDIAYRPGVQQVVGQRSATLPLEVDLRHDEDFWARAQRLQRRLWRDMANKDVTAVRISRELAKRNGWTQRAAFPYVFTNNQGPGFDSMPPGRPAFRLVQRVQHTPQVLVDNQIRDALDGGIFSNIDFVEEAFPPGLPAAVVESYRRMLETLAGPDGADARPDPVPPEHRAVVAAANDTTAPAPPGRLEDGFLRQAAGRPTAVAVRSARRSLTYRELERLSAAVADRLHAQGIGRGDVVPVVMTKGWEQVVAVLGVLRAGATYCPVDVDLPAERIRFLIQECSATVVLRQSHRVPDLGAGDSLTGLDVDELQAGPEPPEADGDECDPAYIIYTSGSTGRPKGVVIEHRAALNTIADVNRRIGLGPGDRVFGISSLSFDLSVWDVFGTLAAGGTLVIPDATARPDPLAWAAAAREHGVTVWNSVPALAEMLVEVTEQRPELGLPPLRAFLLSGDWVPTSLPRRMRALWPATRVIAMGGATEAAIWSNVYEVEDVDPRWQSVPYGRPLTNQTMKVLDHRLDVRPPWAVGEIYIGGIGLARGYWRDEQRTAERFVYHPVTGERLYRTGDLGRYWPDGTIEFLGREDRQVKIQGFRVEPGEIEAACRTHPLVRECVVCVDQAAGGKRLVALVVAEPGERPGRDTVAEHLAARLPRYMVPVLIEVVEALPLTPNGKVDHAAALALVRSAGEPAADLPEGDGVPGPDGSGQDLTERLGRLCAELLEVPSVSPDDDFFDLGGNSLLALRLVNRIRVELGVDIPMGRVFEAATVRGLAGLVAGHGPDVSCMVNLGDGAGEELILFHVLGGAVAPYRPLAQAWAGPVRAFQSRPLVDGSDAAFAPDLETMAAGYREELLRHRPEGPYLLGGASMGGSIAYEVARQLSAQGHECRVVMFDTEIRDIHLPLTDADRHIGFLRTLRLGPPPEDAVAALRAAAPGTHTKIARDAAVAHGLLPGDVDEAGYEHLKRVQEHELALLAAYRPGPLDQRVLLFVAADEPDRPDTLPAWRSVCPGIESEQASGDHFSMIAPDRLPRLAARIGAWLASGRPSAGRTT